MYKKILYVNGDSYTATTENNTLSWAEHLKNLLNFDLLINKSIRGSCNARILRTAMRDCIKLKMAQPSADITVVLGLSFIWRTEVWDSTNINNNQFIEDGEFESFQPQLGNNWFDLFKQNKYTPKNHRELSLALLKYYSDEAELTKLLTLIIGFTSFLKLHNINYYIFFAADNNLKNKITVTDDFIKPFIDYIEADNNIIDLLEFSFVKFSLAKNYVPFDYDQYKNDGHPPAEAHKDFADYLTLKIHNKL